MINALIIDDEFDIFFLLKEMLKTKNIQTTHVGTLTEAKIVLQNNIPEIILLDNNLPDGSGVTFIKHIRDNYPETKIIFFTGDDNISIINKAMEEGAIEYICKPFSIHKVYSIIDKAINTNNTIC